MSPFRPSPLPSTTSNSNPTQSHPTTTSTPTSNVHNVPFYVPQLQVSSHSQPQQVQGQVQSQGQYYTNPTPHSNGSPSSAIQTTCDVFQRQRPNLCGNYALRHQQSQQVPTSTQIPYSAATAGTTAVQSSSASGGARSCSNNGGAALSNAIKLKLYKELTSWKAVQIPSTSATSTVTSSSWNSTTPAQTQLPITPIDISNYFKNRLDSVPSNYPGYPLPNSTLTQPSNFSNFSQYPSTTSTLVQSKSNNLILKTWKMTSPASATATTHYYPLSAAASNYPGSTPPAASTSAFGTTPTPSGRFSYRNPNPYAPQITGTTPPPSGPYTIHSAHSLTTQPQSQNPTPTKRGRIGVPKPVKVYKTPSPRKNKASTSTGSPIQMVPSSQPIMTTRPVNLNGPQIRITNSTGFGLPMYPPPPSPSSSILNTAFNFGNPTKLHFPYGPSTLVAVHNCTPLRPSASLPVPPFWQQHLNDAHSSLETYKAYPVVPGSLEYSTLSNLCSPLQVTSIEQILNPELWTRFTNARKELFRTKCGDLDLLGKLGLEEKEILRAAQLSFNWKQDSSLDNFPYSDNLALLFHCTRKATNLSSILSQGLDERMSSGGVSGAGGLLGRGIYFADNPLKSAAYDGGNGVILLCAVLLGDCLAVDHLPNRSSFVREPEKGKEQKRNCNDVFFDSIVGRPTGASNEYVIYNRYQCVPMYQVRYHQQGARALNNTTTLSNNSLYSHQRQSIPPIAFTLQGTGVVAPNPQGLTQGWAFHAGTIFAQMGVPTDNEDMDTTDVGERAALAAQVKEDEAAASLLQKLDTLNNLGFWDDDKNKKILNKYGNDLDRAVNFLLDENNSQQNTVPSLGTTPPISNSSTVPARNTAAKTSVVIQLSDDDDEADSPKEELPPAEVKTHPPISTTTPTSKFQEAEELPPELSDWALDFDFGFTAPQPLPSMSAPNLDPSPTNCSAIAPLFKEECPICCEEFDYDATNPTNPINGRSWIVLSCSHKVCKTCFGQILKVRDTMSGVSHTSTKCPFCGGNSGIEIGTCPNGTMRVSESPGSCSGYEGYSTWAINYSVTAPKHSVSRTAYIPNTTEGRRILELLKTAWDRRLIFTIGTSNTTGVENTLVWNIHHKTATMGGVGTYGYPDPGYLERVGWELKAYGIE